MAEILKKDSTNELPMFDIEEAIALAVKIHEKGLETAPMQDVAEGCGYANPTSTPFYRRILAARLFKLIGSPKPELTTLALDYLKPDMEEAKQKALKQSIMGIPAYADLIQRHIAKRLNTDLVSNHFSKTFNLTDAGASVCARVFVSSCKFAGFVSSDGTVAMPMASGVKAVATPPVDPPPPKPPADDDLPRDEESQIQTLYLDSKRKRKITIKAPFTVTTSELERIRAWLGFQLIIEESAPNHGQQ